ncbi:MAG: hypothetical protein HQM09_23370 [Candidatus Riflebacteria bacterium]|nr:hypothetical protein [Candidatus Riflebacteria bacterium]
MTNALKSEFPVSRLLPEDERRSFKDFLEAYLETRTEHDFNLLYKYVGRKFGKYLGRHNNFKQMFLRHEKRAGSANRDVTDDGSSDAFSSVWIAITQVAKASDYKGVKQTDIILQWARGKLDKDSDGYLASIFKTSCIKEQKTLAGNEFSNLQSDIRNCLKLLVDKNKIYKIGNYYRGNIMEPTGRGNEDLVDRQVVRTLPLEFKLELDIKPYVNLEQSLVDFLTAERHEHLSWSTSDLTTVFGRHLGIGPIFESFNMTDDEGNPDSSIEHEASEKQFHCADIFDSVMNTNNEEAERAWTKESLALINNADQKQIESIHVGLLWLCKKDPELMEKTGIDPVLIKEMIYAKDGFAEIAIKLNLGNAASLNESDGKSAKGKAHYRNKHFEEFLQRRLKEAERRELLRYPAKISLLSWLVQRYPFPQNKSGQSSEVSHV